MEDITQRFILFYNYLFDNKIIKNASEFAKKIGVSPSLMTELSKGRSNLGTRTIHNTVNHYYLNVDWLFTGNGEMIKSEKEPRYIIEENIPLTTKEETADYIKEKDCLTPLVVVDALKDFGNTDFSIKKQDIQALYKVPDFNGLDFMIRVNGNSMYPKYSSGDIIACRILKDSKFIEWNKPHLIATKEHGLIVKRLHKSERANCLKAISDNPNYEPFDVPKNEITGIAIIVGVIRFD